MHKDIFSLWTGVVENQGSKWLLCTVNWWLTEGIREFVFTVS